jgi:hypothetical protein
MRHHGGGLNLIKTTEHLPLLESIISRVVSLDASLRSLEIKNENRRENRNYLCPDIYSSLCTDTCR